MKHTKLSISLLIVCSILFGWKINSSAAGNEVVLATAQGNSSTSTINGTLTWFVSFSGYVKVKNLAYNKKIIIHYSDSYNDPWKDIEANYVKTLNDGTELWGFTAGSLSIPGWKVSKDYEFAVKYSVNGSEYWDNNNGKNYKVGAGYAPSSLRTLLGNDTNVAVTTKAIYPRYGTDNAFLIYINLRNLAYNKNVVIRYTTDNWRSFTDVNAKFFQSYYQAPEIESWVYDGAAPARPASIEFVVKYEVNGQVYWDNNFGSNYQLSVQ